MRFQSLWITPYVQLTAKNQSFGLKFSWFTRSRFTHWIQIEWLIRALLQVTWMYKEMYPCKLGSVLQWYIVCCHCHHPSLLYCCWSYCRSARRCFYKNHPVFLFCFQYLFGNNRTFGIFMGSRKTGLTNKFSLSSDRLRQKGGPLPRQEISMNLPLFVKMHVNHLYDR